VAGAHDTTPKVVVRYHVSRFVFDSGHQLFVTKRIENLIRDEESRPQDTDDCNHGKLMLNAVRRNPYLWQFDRFSMPQPVGI
jgi:hypothetical protein